MKFCLLTGSLWWILYLYTLRLAVWKVARVSLQLFANVIIFPTWLAQEILVSYFGLIRDMMLTIFKADPKQGLKMGLTKFHGQNISFNWVIKEGSLPGLSISSFFFSPFLLFPFKNIYSLFREDIFNEHAWWLSLLHATLFRSVKFDEALCALAVRK